MGNDFTKDELEIINTALSVYEKRIYGNQSHTRFSSLLKIIGRMIDNYCEHVWTDGSGNNLFCANCHIWGGKR